MTPADIAKRIVASEDFFQIGFIRQLTNDRVAQLIEAKEKQIFQEVWEEMTSDERNELIEAIDVDFPEDPHSIEDLVQLLQTFDCQLEMTTDKTRRDQLLTERLHYENLYQSKMGTAEKLHDFQF